jgi:hypothetical protein
VATAFPGGRVNTLRGLRGLAGDVEDPYGAPPDIYIRTALQIAEAVEAARTKSFRRRKP